jgi:DNA-binding CsgD family transcriptional regulator
MGVRSTRDTQPLLDLVVGAMDHLAEPEPAWQLVCGELMASLRSNLCGVIELDWPAGVSRQLLIWPGWARRFTIPPSQSASHPLIHHFGAHADREHRTIDEVPDTLRWFTSDTLAPARAHFDEVPYQIAMPLRAPPGRVRVVVLGRDRRFTTGDRDHVAAVHPVLVTLDSHLRTVARYREHSAGALPQQPADHRLTGREVAVLSLMAQGLTSTAIGGRLGISPRTVTKHQENIQRKLRTADRLNTVLYAQRAGLV